MDTVTCPRKPAVQEFGLLVHACVSVRLFLTLGFHTKIKQRTF